jgi:hypothetical protein
LCSVLHVFLPASFHVFTAVPNPVLRADSFAISMRSWPMPMILMCVLKEELRCLSDARECMWLRPIMPGHKWCGLLRVRLLWCLFSIGVPPGVPIGGGRNVPGLEEDP